MVVFSSSYEVSIRYIAVLGFQQAKKDTSLPEYDQEFPSAISRYLVSNQQERSELSTVASLCFHPLYRGTWFPTPGKPADPVDQAAKFPSAISRYLVSNPTRKTPPLTSGGGNGLHTPRRIDHIPTFASLNSDKNTRSNHYTPNAGIELSETTPLPLYINPVQNCA